MTIGETLKQEREKQKISLDDISRETKIAKIYLTALETDDVGALPEGVYTRSFLRAYASYLNLDVEQVLSEFHQQFDIKPQSIVLLEQNKEDEQDFLRDRRKSTISLFILIAVLAVGAYLGLKFFPASGFEVYESVEEPVQSIEPELMPIEADPQTPDSGVDDEPQEKHAVQAQVDLPQDLDPPVEDPPSSEPEVGSHGDAVLLEEQTNAPGFPHMSGKVEVVNSDELIALDQVFAIKALGAVWVEVFIDEQKVTKRLLSPGEVRFYRYGSQNRLKIGDASLVAIQDGKQIAEPLSNAKAYLSNVDFEKGELIVTLRRQIQKSLAEE